METAPVKYAIVDGVVEEGLLDFLNEVNPHTAVCMQNPYSRIWSRWPPISWKLFRRLKHG